MGASVLVTGAGHGIGQATALRLAQAGYEVFATARTRDEAQGLWTRARAEGLELRATALDVADPHACEAAFVDIADLTAGGPDAVVNADGFAVARAVEDVTEETAHRLMEINAFAAVRIARLALPVMRRRGRGRIVNLSSAAGRPVLPLGGWYGASRAASSALTHALRMELTGSGVQVVLIEHGFHATGLLEDAIRSLTPPSGISTRFTDCYRNAAAVLSDPTRFGDPEAAAALVHRALTARRPRARYTVGMDARLAAPLIASLPYAISDPLKRVVLGLSGSQAASRLIRALGRFPQCSKEESRP
ncbi:SDR family NAD(P)-dependent oxidoreductase [Streptomyces sp. NBC_00320]|uniref:SDR family NAD(P)-dependent oxidoreductase n=1 Tax=Streptomyces sp. NBC_00320 TaxID=2975711 RepID=UPI00225BC6DC|nr:SDR family NAD(P)-dependent oxidoreductase [Streptomyces sp. NBC_00320]MCX5150867.1 SDR family NAD(P)-dependent oxidoreductase [Streptomyces sp. NBC_00320]